MIFVLLTLFFLSVYSADYAVGGPPPPPETHFSYSTQSAEYRRVQAICSGQAQVEFDRELFFGVNVTSEQIVEHLVFNTSCYQDIEIIMDDATFAKIKGAFRTVLASRRPRSSSSHLTCEGLQSSLDREFVWMDTFLKVLKAAWLPEGNLALQTLLERWVSIKNVVSSAFLRQGHWDLLGETTGAGEGSVRARRTN